MRAQHGLGIQELLSGVFSADQSLLGKRRAIATQCRCRPSLRIGPLLAGERISLGPEGAVKVSSVRRLRHIRARTCPGAQLRAQVLAQAPARNAVVLSATRQAREWLAGAACCLDDARTRC